ncbi:AAA family ATPase [Mycobacterium shigaense]|uniref:Adenylate kinase n=1 Tax=Mycobacterium shigaense TaxID=722731 RepID=A0A1Z4EJ12_9MYCO|nr:bifunctional aminoglycoside phosphotransferase/ATP-binding protein [Mycobacterium shigaense]MEA1124043.1 AAA family ATPase [Mycobacterium shigaense]BAX92941.1 hypothetical protein MSG_02797 [Mycobacterium shigaense]
MTAAPGAERLAESVTVEVPRADLRETHTGVVVLVGDRAYKAKKPVLTDFLDFRTVEQRERACVREVELNSRLSPDSYLGVAHLTGPDGGAAEPVIVMRRYRDQDRLASMVSRGCDDEVRVALDAVARLLARFHEKAERSREIDTQGKLRAVDGRWRENLLEMNWHAGRSVLEVTFDSLARIQRLASEFTSGRAPLFGRRVKTGCIVDGHADLLADDIFFRNGKLAVLDCLEFDDKLRYVDRIDDAACLAMDLEFLGRKDLGDYFLQRYAEHSGDDAPSSLRNFYIAYRAVVRAKVGCVRLSQGKFDAAEGVARHLTIAAQHLEQGSVRLALVGGNPGTGKSTLAGALAERVGAQVISTDDVRHELRESQVITGESGALEAGLYSARNTRAVYDTVLGRARELLGNGQSVILDGTWRDPHLRASARQLATETLSALVELRCVATPDVAADRIATRRPGASEVTPAIAAALACRDSDWDTAHVVDTSRLLEHSAETAQEVWRRSIYAPGLR